MTDRRIDPTEPLPQLEERVLARWGERDVFKRSVEQRAGAQPWVFYEGPPTANGRPGSHHVLARAFKDLYPRFKTMRGYRVERKGGWDCHGLPVEIQVEKQLGLHNKHDIEAYGIAEFNARCRDSVVEFLDDWQRLTERIGYWVDLEHPYRTMDAEYVESVWWALATLHEQGLLFEGHKVVPYCARCGTALSSHEVAQGYEDVEDPSVYVKLPFPAEEASLLVWTTTPWTLVSNAAVAVDPDAEYVKLRAADDDEAYVVAKAAADRLFPDGYDLVAEYAGSDLVGGRYVPPFDFIPAEAYGPKGHTVLPADFVSMDDGTGLVHTAVAFGEDDYRLGAEQGLTVVNPVGLDGTYDERIGPFAGRWVKDADRDLLDDLASRGRLFRDDTFVHAYPHCWRCGTPLLYYAKPSWFVGTARRRDELLAANEGVTWHPEHIKHGRFGNWLEHNVDWAISRERYWGTPLPVWRNAAGETVVIGSLAELEERSGVRLDDPHRPFVDDVTIPSATGGEDLRRVPEVIDVWFDSGCMPFAQHHAPFTDEAKAAFEDQWPADYICEAIDQTRGWFYSLLAVGTLLHGRAPYEDVVCLGHIQDEAGKKMSKSVGNIVPPWDVIDRHGADAFRWYFFASKQPWDGYRFSTDAVGESVRQFLLQLWNTAGFLTTYERADGEGAETDLDRWARSRLAATVDDVTARLDAFDATGAARTLQAFVDDLSNWYLRRSRRRFWDGDPAAFATLTDCLTTVAQLLAPFCPFLADELWDALVDDGGSVHLTDWPEPGPAHPRDAELEAAMATARETVRLGLAARGGAKMKVRQPLAEAVVVAVGAERTAIERLQDLVLDELNVKALRFVEAADELGSSEVKPNYRTLGPRFGKRMPLVAAAVASLDADHVAQAVRGGRQVGLSIEGDEHLLEPGDLLVQMQPLEGYQLEREGTHAVALELAITPELQREGWVRDVVRLVQETRKQTGLEVADRIALRLDGDEDLLAAVREHEAYLRGEVLATDLALGTNGGGASFTVEGKSLAIGLERA